MSATAIYTAVRDLLIAAALGFIVYKIYGAGENAVTVNDMKAVQAQLSANTAQVAAWQKESADANAQRATDLAQVRSDIAARASAPVYVMRNAPSAGPVPSAPTAPGCPAPAGGAAHAGPGASPQPVNIRPELEQFELRYESALADCRAVLEQWPTPEKPK